LGRHCAKCRYLALKTVLSEFQRNPAFSKYLIKIAYLTLSADFVMMICGRNAGRSAG
jgi:hypothetical protein